MKVAKEIFDAKAEKVPWLYKLEDWQREMILDMIYEGYFKGRQKEAAEHVDFVPTTNVRLGEF